MRSTNKLPLSASELSDFRSLVYSQGREHARNHLPWRNIDDAYAVLVSEVMLQQTQVERVLKFWPRWMDAFPTPDALSAASVSDVLELWQGLGYNRRALALKASCDLCAKEFAGKLPSSYEELLELPGVGPSTAAGVMAFAYNKPAVYIETNVRAVYLHCFFPQEERVSDAQIRPYVLESMDGANPRGWYYALLDYGHHLKASVPNPSRRSAAYARVLRTRGFGGAEHATGRSARSSQRL